MGLRPECSQLVETDLPCRALGWPWPGVEPAGPFPGGVVASARPPRGSVFGERGQAAKSWPVQRGGALFWSLREAQCNLRGQLGAQPACLPARPPFLVRGPLGASTRFSIVSDESDSPQPEPRLWMV